MCKILLIYNKKKTIACDTDATNFTEDSNYRSHFIIVSSYLSTKSDVTILAHIYVHTLTTNCYVGLMSLGLLYMYLPERDFKRRISKQHTGFTVSSN